MPTPAPRSNAAPAAFRTPRNHAVRVCLEIVECLEQIDECLRITTGEHSRSLQLRGTASRCRSCRERRFASIAILPTCRQTCRRCIEHQYQAHETFRRRATVRLISLKLSSTNCGDARMALCHANTMTMAHGRTGLVHLGMTHCRRGDRKHAPVLLWCAERSPRSTRPGSRTWTCAPPTMRQSWQRSRARGASS